MTDDELDALLDDLEAGFREDVQAALTLTATEFADAVAGSTELVAAAFSVSRIRSMWTRRVPGLVRRLRSLAGRSARATAEDLGEDVPSPDVLDRELAPYTEATTSLLAAVGERLAAEATQSLAEGVSAGETLPELKARMIAVFSAEGSQLGPGRAERIAMTETTRAWNAGTLAGAQALTGPDRPLVKQWLTRRDDRVRMAHKDVNGQLQLLDDAFDVGGVPMQYPGDPSAPADLTINCRCVMRASADTRGRTASVDPEDLSAAADVHTGAMIALIPSAEDAARLALEGGEDVGQLHVTLAYLGNAAAWGPDDRAAVLQAVAKSAEWMTPLSSRAFGVAQWNPYGDDPVWVYNIGDDPDYLGSRLSAVHDEVGYLLLSASPEIPQQHSPWAPHIAAVYSSADVRPDMVERTGPVVFDRIRVAFADENMDFALLGRETDDPDEVDEAMADEVPMTVGWSTPGETALAFENQQTGDGRVFAPGALYWSGDGPWPIQYADEMLGAHDGAELAGAAHVIGRDGDRITASGVLYLTQDAGSEATDLLRQGAPLGVSVDLDDVDIELLDSTPGAVEAYRLKLLTASLLPTDGGGWMLTGVTEPGMSLTASGVGARIESRKITLISDADGLIPGDLAAAAGDPDSAEGVVVDTQKSGDYLMRITRGRIRGATLVTIPAYANARIVLDEMPVQASHDNGDALASGHADEDHYSRVLHHVGQSRVPLRASQIAASLGVPVDAARQALVLSASKEEVVRLAPGMYIRTAGQTAELTASATGSVNLPVASRDTTWDGDAAATRVFAWADGDADKVAQAFAYRDDDSDPLIKASYKLGYADVLDGTLTIIPAGVSAALGAMNGARGGVDLPAGERSEVQAKLEAVAAHVNEETGGDQMDTMQASAWAAMRDLPPMPADWFREPTSEELPPGGPGVNYANGRIFGWVAQAGEPHAGFAKKVTIDGLGRIDTTHFLRQLFTLDDGSSVRAGAFTMNAGHHRDGAECETSACQFDDTRTVAGIVTVGMNGRGMWFSGAAAPWLSEWDRSVFMSTQPSYHMKMGPGGNWQLRAVLAVPVPGHSSPLMASAVIERSQMALTAAATMAEVEDAVAAEEARQEAAQTAASDAREMGTFDDLNIDYDRLADSLVASMARAEQRKLDQEAELQSLLAEAAKIDLDSTGTEGD